MWIATVAAFVVAAVAVVALTGDRSGTGPREMPWFENRYVR